MSFMLSFNEDSSPHIDSFMVHLKANHLSFMKESCRFFLTKHHKDTVFQICFLLILASLIVKLEYKSQNDIQDKFYTCDLTTLLLVPKTLPLNFI